MVNVPTSLNNLKRKVNDLGVDKLKTVLVDFKKLSDVLHNEVVKNAKFNILKAEVNNLDKNIPDATTLIYINQRNTIKQNLEKKIGDVDKKIPDVSGLVTTTVLNTKISEVENKILDTSSLVVTTVLNAKFGTFENKIADHAKYITTQKFNKLYTKRLFCCKIKTS